MPEALLPHAQARQLLLAYDIPLVVEMTAATASAAARMAAAIGFPVALKALSPLHSHKTDAGLVSLNLGSKSQVKQAAKDMESGLGERPARGFLVQEMVKGGVEMIAGIHHDPQFGPVVLVGSGGVLVELLEDAVLGLPPLTPGMALELLRQTRCWRLLQGFRGRLPADTGALVQLLINLSRLAQEQAGRLQSLDLNPVIVLPQGQGVRAVDYRIFMKGS